MPRIYFLVVVRMVRWWLNLFYTIMCFTHLIFTILLFEYFFLQKKKTVSKFLGLMRAKFYFKFITLEFPYHLKKLSSLGCRINRGLLLLTDRRKIHKLQKFENLYIICHYYTGWFMTLAPPSGAHPVNVGPKLSN